MHPGPSFGRGGEAALGQQLIDEGSPFGQSRAEVAQFSNGILWTFKHQPRAGQVEMQPIAGRQPECRPHLGGYHQAPLLPEYERGIHWQIMPRLR